MVYKDFVIGMSVACTEDELSGIISNTQSFRMPASEQKSKVY